MAAKKKVAKKKTSSKSSSKEIALFEQEMAELAEQSISNETVATGSRMTYNKGEFQLNGDPLGDELDVVVIAERTEHAYYDGPYDKDNPQPPACFAIGTDPEEMSPHENSSDPQADACAQCWANEFGSAEVGAGKACKNSRRIAVISSDDVSKASYDSENVAYINVAPTSIKYFTSFKKKVVQMLGRPFFSVKAILGIEPFDNYNKLTFEAGDSLQPKEVYLVRDLASSITETLEKPFPKPDEYEQPAKKVVKKKTAKKKVAKKKSARRKF